MSKLPVKSGETLVQGDGAAVGDAAAARRFADHRGVARAERGGGVEDEVAARAGGRGGVAVAVVAKRMAKKPEPPGAMGFEMSPQARGSLLTKRPVTLPVSWSMPV